MAGTVRLVIYTKANKRQRVDERPRSRLTSDDSGIVVVLRPCETLLSVPEGRVEGEEVFDAIPDVRIRRGSGNVADGVLVELDGVGGLLHECLSRFHVPSTRTNRVGRHEALGDISRALSLDAREEMFFKLLVVAGGDTDIALKEER